jgi:sugar lactone lactonase YvrE
MKGVLVVLGMSLVAAFPMQGAQAANVAKVKFVAAEYGSAADGGMKNPEGVACQGSSFWVSDTGNRRVLGYTLGDRSAVPVGAYPLPNIYPLAVKAGSNGTLLVLDGLQRRLVRLGKDGVAQGPLDPQGLPAPQTTVVRSFTLDTDDQIYLLDIWGERVVVLDAAGNYLRHVAFPGQHGAFADVAVNFKGDILLVDSVQCRVYVADKSATVFAPLTGSLKEFMDFPTAIDSDGQGNIYLLDQHGSGLVLLGPDGTYLGRQLSLGWDEAGLYYPTQLCLGMHGLLVIADRNNSRVQVFNVVWK